jgi:hypothetical protein
MIRTASMLAVAVVLGAAMPAGAEPATSVHPIGPVLCRNLAEAVQSFPGQGALFLASYRNGPNEGEVPLPLRSSAFSYDNALATIALVACDRIEDARRIGDAFHIAIQDDRKFKDGRIRNAYRAGPVDEGPVALPGWWDTSAKLWAEDPNQDGTATGNVAWVALALLTLEHATGNAQYLEDAVRLLGWIAEQPSGAPGPAGYPGGYHGFDDAQRKLTWKSTEHNVDTFAAARAADARLGTNQFAPLADTALGFLHSAFESRQGAFRLGTEPDGRLAEMNRTALDTQLWPLLAVGARPPEWERALAYAEAHLAVKDGFDFNNDRDGLWVEGTAQAALTYAVVGKPATADHLLDILQGQIAPSGWLFATREPQITTGLPLSPDSTSNDFLYFRRPHLGATAWAVIAANRWNPFTGRRIP